VAFIDEADIKATAGRGGDGVVRWLHEKGREYGGPSGGNGGKGGSVHARAVRDVSALARFRHVKTFKAQRGESGKSKLMHGAAGEDLIIDVPIGSVIVNKHTDERFELLREDEKVLLLLGGAGGLGNAHFKSSVNQRPKEFTSGADGESASFYIELQLIADVGLIGLPNAGKSSLLNALTRANARVGSYAFTTLEPNLGVMHGLILADIPGLIEGAAEGKGLGHKFLRHIKRTRVLVHCISLEQEDVLGTYRTVRAELKKYHSDLLQKKEIIVLMKTDLVDSEIYAERAKLIKKETGEEAFGVSILDDASVKKFGDALARVLQKGNDGNSH